MTQEELDAMPIGSQVEYGGMTRYTKTGPATWEYRFPEGNIIAMSDLDLVGPETKKIDPLVMLAELQD